MKIYNSTIKETRKILNPILKIINRKQKNTQSNPNFSTLYTVSKIKSSKSKTK